MSDIVNVDLYAMYNGKISSEGVRSVECETYNIELSAAASERVGAYHNKNVNGVIQYRDYLNGCTQILVGVAGDQNGVKSFGPLNGSKGEFTMGQVNDILALTQEAISVEKNNPDFELDKEIILRGTEFAEEKKPSLLESLKARLHKNSEASEKKSFEQMSARDQWRYENGGID